MEQISEKKDGLLEAKAVRNRKKKKEKEEEDTELEDMIP